MIVGPRRPDRGPRSSSSVSSFCDHGAELLRRAKELLRQLPRTSRLNTESNARVGLPAPERLEQSSDWSRPPSDRAHRRRSATTGRTAALRRRRDRATGSPFDPGHRLEPDRHRDCRSWRCPPRRMAWSSGRDSHCIQDQVDVVLGHEPRDDEPEGTRESRPSDSTRSTERGPRTSAPYGMNIAATAEQLIPAVADRVRVHHDLVGEPRDESSAGAEHRAAQRDSTCRAPTRARRRSPPWGCAGRAGAAA